MYFHLMHLSRRFHSLVEFDEGKRSCRKRLDGHNRRRRKPQPEALTRNPGLLFSNQQGTRLVSFGSSRETFTSGIVSSAWAGIVNADNDTPMYSNHPNPSYMVRQNSFTEGLAQSYRGGGNEFHFMQGSGRALPGHSIHQPLIDPNGGSADSNGSQRRFCDGLNQVFDSDRALSLLSSAPAVTREIGLSHQGMSMRHDGHSLANNLQFSSSLGQYEFAQKMESKPVISITDSEASTDSRLHFSEMFQNGGEGSSTSGSQQTLTFTWE